MGHERPWASRSLLLRSSEKQYHTDDNEDERPPLTQQRSDLGNPAKIRGEKSGAHEDEDHRNNPRTESHASAFFRKEYQWTGCRSQPGDIQPRASRIMRETARL